MLYPFDTDDQDGLGATLTGAQSSPATGLGATLTQVPAASAGMPAIPATVAVQPVPFIIDSRDGKTRIPLTGTPGAFAANSQTPLENLLSGYGGETEDMARNLKNFAGEAFSAATGNPAAAFIKEQPDPNQDLHNQLGQASPMARLGAFAADQINTAPLSMAGGAAVAPLAGSIKATGLMPDLARLAITDAGQNIAKSVVSPADDLGGHLQNTAVAGASGAKDAVEDELKKRARAKVVSLIQSLME